MDDAVQDIIGWGTVGKPAVVARVIAMTGFGGRRSGEMLAVAENGETAGSLLGGAATPVVEAESRSLIARNSPWGSVIDLELGDPEAVSAGLACGGVARLLVQRLDAIPPSVWAAMANRVPVAMATLLHEPQSSTLLASEVATSTSRPESDNFATDPSVSSAGAALLSQGRTAVRLVETDRGTAAVEAFVPLLRLVIAGAADLSGSIERQAALLGWQPSTTDGPSAADAVHGLGPADAVVVLSHDAAVYSPVLTAALQAGCGYVGALGSRHTQATRRQLLIDSGLSPELVATIHGPAGLDLGAGSPEETALAICAEIIAVRSGRAGTSLRDTSGPINS